MTPCKHPLAQGSRKVFPIQMARPRIDPSAPGEHISGIISAEMHNRVIELSNERGTSRSAVLREVLELGLEALDEDGE